MNSYCVLTADWTLHIVTVVMFYLFTCTCAYKFFYLLSTVIADK